MKKLYLTIFFMVLTILAFALPVYADSYYDTNGYYTVEARSYDSTYDYTSITGFNPSPVVNQSVSIPSGYSLAGFGVSTYNHNCRYQWVYAPSGGSPFTCYYTFQGVYLDTSSLNYNLYMITDNVSSSGALTFYRTDSFDHMTLGWSKFTLFVPVLDENGNLARPENQISFNLNSSYDTDTNSLFFNASSSSYTSNSVHFYLFPSSVSINSGSSSNLISEQYFTEIPVLSAELMHQLGLDVQYKIWEANRDISIFSLVPELVFLDTTTSIRHGTSFDPSVYGVPYLDLGSKNFHSCDNNIYLTQTYCLNVPNMDKSKSGVYLYNDLCVVAVVDYENVFFTARFDFNRNLLKSYGVVAPSYPSSPDSYFSGTVSDLQDLADYLQYLYTTNDNNRNKQDNNIIAYLQAIPWTNFVAGGTYQGLNDWLPELSDSIDYTFGNLFTDYFIPTPEQMSELEDELEDDREEFEAKFAFIDDVKDEVSFIFETIMRSGDQTRYFEFNLTNYHGVGVVQMNISDKIPANVLSIVKNFITCFLTIAVVMHIFKTLPSTIGKMPSGGD